MYCCLQEIIENLQQPNSPIFSRAKMAELQFGKRHTLKKDPLRVRRSQLRLGIKAGVRLRPPLSVRHHAGATLYSASWSMARDMDQEADLEKHKLLLLLRSF